MKTKIMIQMTRIVWAAGALLLLASCDVKDPIYNTPHPGHGMVTLTTDWSGIGVGLTAPASYRVAAFRATSSTASYSATLTGVTNKLDHLFEPGEYRFYVHNPADEITVEGTVARVAAEAVSPAEVSAAAPASRAADAPERLVRNTPGWLFSSSLAATLTADSEHTLTAPMQQQVRQLTLLIEPTGGTTDQIVEIVGTLSGVAGTLDMESGTHGSPSHVMLRFDQITSGVHVGKWTTTVRLLGIAGGQQELSGIVRFTGEGPDPIPLYSDLTVPLTSFNDDKRTPLTLDGTLVETPTEAGFTASIDDWQIGFQDDVVAQ